MIQINFPPQNIEEQRRRALSKVYALLIRLAEEAENRATPSVIDSDEKKVAKTTSVPLQNNFPPAV
jgi:hypothetical protein